MHPISTIIKHTSTIVAYILITFPSNAAEYEIEPVGSYILFDITHFKVGTAHGRFNDFKGTVTYDPNSPEKSKLNFTIKAASVDTGHKKRDDHLRNKDFFDVVQFPEIQFKSQSVDKGKITGQLTMLGKTKSITATYKVNGIGQHFGNKRPLLGAVATFSINRSDFGMKFGLPDALSDRVNIKVSIGGLGK